MCKENHVHSINCILPPHMLESIKTRGDDHLKQMAEELILSANEFRNERQDATPANSYMAAPLTNARAVSNKNREIFNGNNSASLPGTRARFEGDPATGDAAIDDAYDGSGVVYDLYYQEFQRDSLDGYGMTMRSTVHHRRNYNNAFWNGQQMVYGDGDGRIFKRMTEFSVIGHELSHGVVQHSGGLIYRDESGALNESFADVFGALTVQYQNKQTAREASWLIGDGILGDDINGCALRSMIMPGQAYNDPVLGKDPQPYHMDYFVYTQQDNGGVHINSGIPNHAFYLLSQYLGGYAWEKAGHIWYDTMQSIQNPHATFYEWADTTVEMANQRFGTGSLEAQCTKRAWKLVGVL